MSEEIGPGRPTKYKPEYCEELIKHMEAGYSYSSFAAKIGINRRTFYDWELNFPEWGEAKDIAFDKCLLFWEKIGIENVVSVSETIKEGSSYQSSKSKSLNSTVWTFNMINRFGWRNKSPDEVDTVVNNNNSNSNVTGLSNEELDAKIAEKLKKKSE